MPGSTKHVHLYQKLGFWPHYLTALTALEVPGPRGAAVERCSLLPDAERAAIVEGCRVLADAIHPGLDLGCEIRLVVERGRGETVIVGDTEGLAGFAVCHGGPGSEAVPGTCYVKFAAARPGAGAADRFEQVLDAVEEHAATAGFSRVEAGVNLARRDAYRALAARGYRTFTLGVAMHRPDREALRPAGRLRPRRPALTAAARSAQAHPATPTRRSGAGAPSCRASRSVFHTCQRSVSRPWSSYRKKCM